MTLITSALLMAALAVDGNVPAGNVVVEKIEGDTIRLSRELRDTTRDWFYWAFRVKGAGGRTLTFKFDEKITWGGPVGVRGPAVTTDGGKTWSYPCDGKSTKSTFSYTFASDDEVCFYETWQYLPPEWEAFLAGHAAERGKKFVADVLCKSRKGRDVPKARFGCIGGKPKFRIFMSSRHHCSEATATPVLEGVAAAFLADDDLGRWLCENVELMVVPFVDYDGAVDGDQGKGRAPHDHNRDYSEFIYPETRAIRDWIMSHANGRLDIFIDVHCPWIRDNTRDRTKMSNEFLYTPWKDPQIVPNATLERRYSELLEQLQCGSMRYRASDDLAFGKLWNNGVNYKEGWSAVIWACKTLKGLKIARSYEVPFANANGAVVTPETCRDLGRDTANVFRALLVECGGRGATALVAAKRNAFGDAFAAPELSSVRLSGRAGASAAACLAARAYSAWARGEMYEECVNAFRTHQDDRSNGWQNEYWGKTMLCFAGAAAYTQDVGLKAWIVGKTHAFLKEFQKPNGYLSTYTQEDFLRKNPENPDAKRHWCFNVWGQKYTLWALVDIYRATGDADARAGAVKMADHLIAQLKRLNLTIDRTGSWFGISSMSILRPMLELYRIEKNPSYLALCREIVSAMDREPYSPASLIHNAFRKENVCTWYPEPGFWAKAYEIQSCLEGLVDYYRLTGEKHVLDAVLAFYGHLEREEMNPMKSAGHFDHFWNAADQLNGMTELCDVTHWIRLNRELLLVTGEAKYAERIEEAFYNAFLAGVTRDGRWGAHIVRSHGSRHFWALPQTGMFHHQCCPDNMMRTYFDFARSIGGVDAAGTLSVALYGDAEAQFPGVRMRVTGGYPYADGPVAVTVVREKAGKVRFRVPTWSKTFSLNGQSVTDAGDWYAVDAPAGTSSWSLAFDLAPRVKPWTRGWRRKLPASGAPHSITDVDSYTVYFMEWYSPDMVGLARSYPGIHVMRGPLMLAKGRLAGTSRADTFFSFATENGMQGWSAALKPLAPTRATAGVPRAWTLTLSRGAEERSFVVSDFASLSNVDDPDNWFSLWF